VAGGALCAVAVGAREAGRSQLRDVEARVFADLNNVSERWHRPVWTVMQLGSLGGSLAVGAATAAAGQARLGRRLATVGALAWIGSKAVKPFARRGRPAAVIAATRVLGREQAGLGYPSGHAAVSVAMALAAVPRVPTPWRGPLWLTAVGVGAARMYVGAHLPLDVAGGIALGVATERTVRAFRGPA
jgi:undecaprenyl-diphosphatase